MTLTALIIILLLNFIVGIFTYGFAFATLQRSFPYLNPDNSYYGDMLASLLMGFIGIVGLIFLFVRGETRKGLKFY